MAEIVHRFRVNAAPAEVLRAVREQALRVAFWPIETKISMRATSEAPPCRITREHDVASGSVSLAWACLDGPPEWVGTLVSFDVAPEGDETVVRFAHRNWRASTDFMAQCATSWARVLLDLKSQLEVPEPDDLLI